MSGSTNTSLVRVLAQTLSEDELSALIQELQDTNCSNTGMLSELRYVLSDIARANRFKGLLKSEILRKNEPVKQLLD